MTKEAETQTEERGPERVTTAAQLKKRAVHHDITLPSGAVVDIKLPNLNQMIKAGELPNELIEASLRARKENEVTRDTVEREWDFMEFIVPLTLVRPKIAKEDVAELDPNDVAMIAAFAARQTDIDAVGHQLGGLDTQDSFRRARGLVTFDEALADLP